LVFGAGRHVWLVARPLSNGHCPAVLPFGFRAHPRASFNPIQLGLTPDPILISGEFVTELKFRKLGFIEHNGNMKKFLKLFNFIQTSFRKPRRLTWTERCIAPSIT
jgi:hypothetical protein